VTEKWQDRQKAQKNQGVRKKKKLAIQKRGGPGEIQEHTGKAATNPHPSNG